MIPVPRNPRSARAAVARMGDRPGTPGTDLWIERAAFILGVVLFVLSILALRSIADPPSRLAPHPVGAPLSVLEWNDHAQEA